MRFSPITDEPDGKSLSQLRAGQKGYVRWLRGPEALRHRLADMGMTPGTEIQICKRAPFGDPMEIQLRGYRLVLRRAEARHIFLSGSQHRRDRKGAIVF